MLELSFRFQALHDDSYNSWAQFRVSPALKCVVKDDSSILLIIKVAPQPKMQLYSFLFQISSNFSEKKKIVKKRHNLVKLWQVIDF